MFLNFIYNNFIFIIISFFVFFSSILVIGCKNPIHSILSLILVFCSSSIFFLIFDIEFLALIFIVVYVGAISVLFLFVIMMLNIKMIEINENLIKYVPISSFIFFIFIFEIYFIFSKNIFFLETNFINYIDWLQLINKKTNMENLGEILYTYFFQLFLLSSLILLVAMIGPIVLTLTNNIKNNKRQNIFEQITKSYNLNLKKKNV